MNRHQSNPFLAGWETNDEAEVSNVPNVGGVTNQADAAISGETAGRRHSQSGNPFRTQRPADRRLYHRNMSSFDAASVQLEQQQQQMQENGSKGLDGGLQTEIIAKMTADFQSAIENKDKEFAVDEILDEDGNPIDFNPFDPFETIVDDDISLPSPALTASSDQRKLNRLSKDQEDENATMPLSEVGSDNLERSENMDLDGKPKTSHDSIDEDEEDLVSTPVRNIKSSSPQRINADESASNSQPNSGLYQATLVDEYSLGSAASQSIDQQNNMEKINSLEKASLFASLLASAESGGQPTDADEIRQSKNVETDAAGTINETSTSPSQLENPTHVIKGSHSAADGDRPVGFFDPFETVIDKDELTSLMNETSQLTVGARDEDLDETYAKGPKVPDPTPIHGPKSDQSGEKEHSSGSFDNQQDHSGAKLTNTVNDDADRLNGIPRPARVEVIKQDQQSASLTKTTPSKRPKSKKKPSFQEDSSDSSEDDDRIQIVIKARGTNQTTTHSGPAFVPLLPPPPSKSSMKQARERGQVDDIPSPAMSYKSRHERKTHSDSDSSDDLAKGGQTANIGDDSKKGHSRDGVSAETTIAASDNRANHDEQSAVDQYQDSDEQVGQFVIPMTHSDDDGDAYGKPDTPLYDEDTSYVLDDFPAKYEGPGWEMMLRYPPKKKLTSNRFWKKIFVKLAQVPIAPEVKSSKQQQQQQQQNQDPSESAQMCIALQIFDKPEDKKPMQEIPIQATYTVSEISSQQFDQFGKIFTIKLQYIFYKERVGVRQGQLARFIHTGHIGSSTTSGGHGADPISIGAIKRLGAPIEHSPQISQIIKLGCTSYNDIKQFKNCLEDYLFKMPIHRDRALSSYKTEEVQMAVRDETYLELNQVGTIIKQLARVRIFFLSFLNGMPTVEVGINDIHRQGREVVGRMDILPVMTEEWIRLEACELHSTVDKDELENPDSRIIKLVPPDATFFELLRFRIRPPRNRELPLQISANMSVTRTKVSINCDIMVPGCVSRKHGQIPCEAIAIKVFIPECWIYFFREEKHFRMGSKKSVNRRPGKVKGIERLLGGGGLQDINDESSLIEVTSGQAKYEHHHNAIVWRAARWPKESQSAYVQNNMKIRLPLTAYDKMPDSFCEYVNVEYTMPSTTVSHTTLRSISVNPCDDEPPEKYVKYSAKYEYKVKMRLSINLGSKPGEPQQETSPIVIMKQPDLQNDLQREEDSDNDDEEDDDEELNEERGNAD